MGNTSFFRRFTLIELLVVIAIIAVLAGILLPTLGRARENASMTECRSGIRQLAVALQQYAYDSKNVLPPFYNSDYSVFLFGEPKSDGTYGATGGISDYLGNSENIRVCPSMPDVTSQKSTWNNSGCGGYGYNQFYLSGSDGRHPVRLNRVKKPDKTIAFADAIGFSNKEYIEMPTITPPVMSWSASPDMHFRHNKNTNAAWLDGHVSSERMTFTRSHYSGLTEAECKAEGIGWFGPEDNSYFDLQ